MAQKYRLAVRNRELKYLRKSRLPLYGNRCLIASMSSTTLQREHSPIRRRKSMSLAGPRNIKVIVFGRAYRWPDLRRRRWLARSGAPAQCPKREREEFRVAGGVLFAVADDSD